MILLLLLFFLATLLLAFLLYLHWPFSYWKTKNVEYDRSISIYGSIAKNVSQKRYMGEILNDLYTQFKDEPYFGIYTFFKPTLVIKDPNVIKEVAIQNVDVFIEHRLFSSGDKSHRFSKNLFVTTGAIWRNVRANLSPAFTGSKMRMMYNALVNECAKQCVKSVDSNGDELTKIEIKYDLLSRYTSDVISTCIFGLDNNSFIDRDNEFFKRYLEVSNFGGRKVFALFGYCLKTFLVKFFDIRIIPKEDENFFAKVVLDTIKIRHERGILRPDMVNLLMEARKGNLEHDSDKALSQTGFATIHESSNLHRDKMELTDDDIIGHSLLFLIAGSDTASCGMTFLFYELAKNRSIQDRLFAEIEEYMSQNSKDIIYEDVLQMKYLDMVCCESLRKWPPLPVTDRVAVKPFTIRVPNREPVHLEEGSVLWIPIFPIHRDPDNYENPDVFDPERFNDENKGRMRNETYMPFGIGAKGCIGSRLALLMFKSITIHLLYNFEVIPIEETPAEIGLSKKHIFLNADGPVVLGFKPRRRRPVQVNKPPV